MLSRTTKIILGVLGGAAAVVAGIAGYDAIVAANGKPTVNPPGGSGGSPAALSVTAIAVGVA